MLSGVFGFGRVRYTPNLPKACVGFTHIDFCCKRAGEKWSGAGKNGKFRQRETE